LRIKYGVPLTGYQRSTFYTLEEPRGYTDYPAATVAQLMGARATVIPKVEETISLSTLVSVA